MVEGSLTLKLDEATLKPLFAEIEKSARRTEGDNNLKQIGLAMLNHEAAMGTLPPAALCDRSGKPLLSWRVAILPYIEQENLYRQFKLDEPWDSPNNSKLLAMMPKVYALPGREAKKGETFFRVFAGPNTPYPPELLRTGGGPSLVQFTDGTSNTLLVVESSDSTPWTKPDELTVDPMKPLPKLGGALPDGFLALFADGSVHVLPKKIPEKTLRNLIDPNDGNVVDWQQIEPNRRREQPRQPGNQSSESRPSRPKEQLLPPEPNPPSKPPAAGNVQRPQPPSTVQAPVGVYEAPGRGPGVPTSILLQKRGETWKRVIANTEKTLWTFPLQTASATT